jgi:hypothetical protein
VRATQRIWGDSVPAMSPISEQPMAGLTYPGRHGYKIGWWICRLGSHYSCRAWLWSPEGRRLPALAGSSASRPARRVSRPSTLATLHGSALSGSAAANIAWRWRWRWR